MFPAVGTRSSQSPIVWHTMTVRHLYDLLPTWPVGMSLFLVGDIGFLCMMDMSTISFCNSHAP